MCNARMNQHMEELAKLRMMKSELEELITKEEEAIKAFMSSNQLEELVGEQHKVSYKQVTSSRLDSAALKKSLPDIAAQFMRSSSSMRFTFA